MIEPPPLAPTVAALPLPPRDGLHVVSRAGFGQVQLSAAQPGLRPRDLDGSGRRDLLSLMRRLELSCAGIDFLIPPNHYVEAATADRAAGAANAAIELAADLGRVALTIDLTPILIQSGPESESNAMLDAIRAHAERFGVALANIGDPGPRVEGVGLAIDAAALALRETSLASALGAAAESLVSVRCSGITETGARVPFGRDSRFDPLELQVALSISGYRGPVVLDARGWADPVAGLSQSAEVWSNVSPFQNG